MTDSIHFCPAAHTRFPSRFAGKTTLLRHVLQNSTLKIGCIVNDVASVNIDAKLIRNDANRGDNPNSVSDLTDTIELANGCACCSIVDELFDSFANLLQIADRRGIKYDRIILENSGVAEPQNIRDQFVDATTNGHPLIQRIRLDSLFTVVDSATFIKDFSSKAPVGARPDLGEGGNMRPVVDLLVEQVECADCIVLNKIDMLSPPSLVDSLAAIVTSLNPLADVHRCEQGKIDIEKLFGSAAKEGLLASLTTEGQHRGAVIAAKKHQEEEKEEKEGDECKDKGCTDPEHHHHEHKHDHHHHHKHEHEHECKDEGCKDPEHHHHEDHHHEDHHHESKHDHHHHDHKHEHEHECKDEGCNDPEHHHHDQDDKKEQKDRQATTAAKRFGITSFVYSRRLPFHPQRLRDLVLRWMPVTHNKAIGDTAPETGPSPIQAVLRSKGYMWIANGHNTAFYWSHAGQHFEIRDEGEWWAAVPNEYWPTAQGQRGIILTDYDGEGDWGDRRQEIVFIGAGMDKEAIEQQLDGALLSEEEMGGYRVQYQEPDPGHVDTPRSKKMKKEDGEKRGEAGGGNE